MDTQTQPKLKEPQIPVNVALDTEDSSIINVCFPGGNHPERISVYIHSSDVHIEEFLDSTTGLESRVFPCSPLGLRDRFLESMGRNKPDFNEERSKDRYYILHYGISLKEQVYDAIRKL